MEVIIPMRVPVKAINPRKTPHAANSNIIVNDGYVETGIGDLKTCSLSMTVSCYDGAGNAGTESRLIET